VKAKKWFARIIFKAPVPRGLNFFMLFYAVKALPKSFSSSSDDGIIGKRNDIIISLYFTIF